MLRRTRPYEILEHVLNKKKAFGTLQMPALVYTDGWIGYHESASPSTRKEWWVETDFMNHCLVEKEDDKGE